MEYNGNYGTPPNAPNSSNNPGFTLGLVSTILGILSLCTFCVPWLTLIIAIAGLTCGIISWKTTKKAPGAMTLPIIGTVVSGVAVAVSTVLVVLFHLALHEISKQYEEFENMQDSLSRWDSQFNNFDNLPEADSTFFIDN